jgi:DNA-3-methyladenine glycosylase I
MEKTSSYCEYVNTLEKENLHKIYHDSQYGFPILSDNELFGRLILEINQAGLSWTTILKKQNNFRQSFSNFNIKQIANYGEKEINILLNNPGIVRNKLKINAVIFNANRILEIQKNHGLFSKWLDNNLTTEIDEWVKLFKQNFKFTGGEITKEFLFSTGYLKGAHIETCPIYKKLNKLNPKWKNNYQ